MVVDIHFRFPITADLALCGELAEREPVVVGIEKATCPRCRNLIGELDRHLPVKAATETSALAAKA